MKNYHLLISLGIILVLTLSNFTTNDRPAGTFVFTSMSEEPVLPNIPYSYSSIEMPEHLKNADPEPDPSGYQSFNVNINAFDLLEDNLATLGRVLFYDKKMSALENISCATCHNQADSFTEPKAFSEGVLTPTTRNSMHLNDLAWTANNSFFWDMRHSNMVDMITLPLTDQNELGADIDQLTLKLEMTNYYPELFTKAFGDSNITEDRIVDAIVNFISSINTFNSEFDQAAEDDFAGLTQSQENGLELFAENCTTCHTEGPALGAFGFANFTSNVFQIFPFIFSNGLPVNDLEDRGVGNWNSDFKDLFKIPSLRNIELTAPYMHDGRFDTMEEVIDFYSEGTVLNEWTGEFIPPGGFQFDDQQKSDLLNFVQLLTDETMADNPMWSDPFASVTAVEDIQIMDVVVKPNPISDVSILEFENTNGTMTYIHVYDNAGKLLFKDQTNQNQYRINKSDFLTGMYLIELTQSGKKSTQKLIVQ